MQGEDGRDYVFLLKGHEDLRQDERVMQLFGQVNNRVSAIITIGRFTVAAADSLEEIEAL